MYKKLSADWIFPVSASPIEDGVLVLDENNAILHIGTIQEFDAIEVHKVEGFLVPGFINAHCHLELSHLKNIAPTGTGLIDFIGHVIRNRNHPLDVIYDAIKQAEQEMKKNGIVAVGDIANTIDTKLQKQKNNLYYYTFVEYFDLFQPNNLLPTIDQYDAVFEQFQTNEFNKKGKTPHAPYSVSPSLFSYIMKDWQQSTTISIHNQETVAENELFASKTGDLVAFYHHLNYEIDAIPNHQRAINYAIDYLSSNNRNLFVHNTLSTIEDITLAHQKLGVQNCFWCSCPNANLYIENRLPNYNNFLTTHAQVCLGTDSLTSNWELNIFEEIKTILKYNSYLNFEEVLNWATINGARALGWEHKLGTFEIGKTPGVVQITATRHKSISSNSEAKNILI